jgi:hypothetical protein
MNNKTNSTETFYKEIITKVLEQSKELFGQAGVSEETLIELKKIWFEKLTTSGIFSNQKNQLYTQRLGVTEHGYGVGNIVFKTENTNVIRNDYSNTTPRIFF